jgi:hypothetical protein
MLALVAFAAALVVNAAALAINQLIRHGSGVGPGPLLGIASLGLQALIIIFVARRSVVARALVVTFFVLSTLPLPMIGRLVAAGSSLEAAYLSLSFAFKGVATWLLFTGASRAWFSERFVDRSSNAPAPTL